MRPPWVAFVLVACASCAGAEVELYVDLRTDFVPTQEFIGARVQHGDRTHDHVVLGEAPYEEGVRIAEIPTGPGTVELHVSLVDTRGEVLVERPVLVTADASRTVTVVVTRDCRGVTCPLADGNPLETACLGGQCVSPECLDGTGAGCGEPSCTEDAECSAAACARPRCEAGVCLRHGTPDACGDGSYCDPDLGCRTPPEQGLVIGPPSPEPLVLYTFEEGEGDLVRDRSARFPYLDLAIEDPATVAWRDDGLEITEEGRLLQVNGTASTLVERLHRIGQFTLEAWVEDGGDDGGGPNRVFTLEQSPSGAQDLMLGTSNGGWVFRLDRDPAVDNEFRLGSVSYVAQHVVVPYDGATLRAYLEGVLASEHEAGSGLPAWDSTRPPTLSVANVPPAKADDQATGDRFWTGVLRRVALHEVSWTAEEVAAAFEAGFTDR